ncbi:hypothetical protein I600_333 [Maribacter dokdonensis DSW-8]|nr:hypothetical protein I600_333 [Maribacter dokdonensis DSW-8]
MITVSNAFKSSRYCLTPSPSPTNPLISALGPHIHQWK